jgi:hypothetical protein
MKLCFGMIVICGHCTLWWNDFGIKETWIGYLTFFNQNFLMKKGKYLTWTLWWKTRLWEIQMWNLKQKGGWIFIILFQCSFYIGEAKVNLYATPISYLSASLGCVIYKRGDHVITWVTQSWGHDYNMLCVIIFITQ